MSTKPVPNLFSKTFNPPDFFWDDDGYLPRIAARTVRMTMNAAPLEAVVIASIGENNTRCMIYLSFF
jgi:hypothetical protein